MSGVDESVDKGLEWKYTEEETNSMDVSEVIPFSFRGRDFDTNFHLYYHPFYELSDTYFILFTSKNYPFNCPCRKFAKCQRLVIYQPISYKYAVYAATNHIKFNITHHLMNVGKSSKTVCSQLTQVPQASKTSKTSKTSQKNPKAKDESHQHSQIDKLILAEIFNVYCHIDNITNRPIPVCENAHKLMKNKLDNTNNMKEINNFNKIRLPHFRHSINILQQKMDCVYSDLKKKRREKERERDKEKMSKALFIREFDIRLSNLDFNGHVNQGAYCRMIEDALGEYNVQFFKGKKYMYYFDQIFLNEMRYDNIDGLFINEKDNVKNLNQKQENVKYNNLSKCQIEFWFDEIDIQLTFDKPVTLDGEYCTFELKNGVERIIGSVTQKNKPCLYFSIVLVDVPKDKYHVLPSARFASKL